MLCGQQHLGNGKGSCRAVNAARRFLCKTWRKASPRHKLQIWIQKGPERGSHGC